MLTRAVTGFILVGMEVHQAEGFSQSAELFIGEAKRYITATFVLTLLCAPASFARAVLIVRRHVRDQPRTRDRLSQHARQRLRV